VQCSSTVLVSVVFIIKTTQLSLSNENLSFHRGKALLVVLFCVFDDHQGWRKAGKCIHISLSTHLINPNIAQNSDYYKTIMLFGEGRVNTFIAQMSTDTISVENKGLNLVSKEKP
jgi:hypothetical protein